jgi:hypothetical protein
MKKLIAVILLLTTTCVFAYDDNPTALFDASQKNTNQSLITWRTVDDVLGECNRENKRLGISTFGYAVLACSFWERKNGQDVCTIITGKQTSMHSIGHEMRHCFQGKWHG